MLDQFVQYLMGLSVAELAGGATLLVLGIASVASLASGWNGDGQHQTRLRRRG